MRLAFLTACCFYAFSLLTGAHATERPWPFYVPKDTSVPVIDGQWGRNPIDAFVLRRLQEKGLQPAPQADRRTLVRRLYFTFIGLPPTPQQVEQFVADSAPDAYERLVDRVLEDPRYGERWARFWLDLARYADTAGYEGDPDLPHAWRYRDYVIDAFNHDKPYDVFAREQIAGDEFKEIMGAGELPNVPAERLVALTFLRLAPFTEPRGDETRHEMLSEMTSTVGSVFLGLTVGCAKCHDHKHDDIPTADFYRMKAFFATIQIPPPERGDVYQIGGALPAQFYRPAEANWVDRRRRQFHMEVEQAAEELAALRTQIESRVPITETGFGIQSVTRGNDYALERRPINDGKMHWSAVSSNGDSWRVQTDGQAPTELLALSGQNRGSWFGDLKNPRYLGLGGYTKGTGSLQSVGAFQGLIGEVLVYDRPLDPEQLQKVGDYISTKYAGDANTVPPQSGLKFWLDASDLDDDLSSPNTSASSVDRWTDKIGGITLVAQDSDHTPTLSRLGPASTPAVLFEQDYLRATTTDASFLGDQVGTVVLVYATTKDGESYGFEVGGDRQFLSTVIYPKQRTKDLQEQLREFATADERARFAYLSSRERFVDQHLKRLLPVAMSLRHSLGPPFEPGVPTSRIMIRGEYDNLGEVVEPGFLSCISGNQQPAEIRLDPFKRWPTRSRRMALANWIVSQQNPMTARVMVNRLWYWQFGQGIVSTPSDFGYLSGGPSHPMLLDWLAERFMEDGYSVKAMHRRIATSATFRQASNRADEVAAELDPDNRLLWRFPRRRLSAEAIRDSVLAVSGRLNLNAFGLPSFPPLPGDIAEAVKYTDSKWDTQDGKEGRRRSIYIYQQRTLTMPLMQTFDAVVCDESRPRRRASVTSLQALAMYNGEFVNAEAEHFARRVRSQAGSDPTEQVTVAFRLAFGRVPHAEEHRIAQTLLNGDDASDDGLVGLCRVLLNASEFVYLD